ncbi:hypothetical protein [Thermodesulfobacterium hydrogeniphilum]|uniref:hypothetical protein n=1 Tax=Thermodesulfobacterium hydrogeniphilum TaxID=161156 RepID=UPI0012EC927A|nr:hypothetical protein [Thermodesulfobacterium hydrogeniphilum]
MFENRKYEELWVSLVILKILDKLFAIYKNKIVEVIKAIDEKAEIKKSLIILKLFKEPPNKMKICICLSKKEFKK